MKRLNILTLSYLLLSGVIFFGKKRMPTTIPAGEGLVIKKEWLTENKDPVTPKEYIRPADQTFLTFPEWYLVFSPDEQAQYFKHTTSTSFPFMSHVAQIWQSYKVVNNQIKNNYPYNGGYHFMIWVIGTSTTVEYSMKALYETVIGRLTDTKQVITAEDKFNAQYTQEYVDFIKDRPWYEFNFKRQLGILWKQIPFKGDHFFRKIERRYILTSELGVKYLYGKLIGLGTKSVYGEAAPSTAVLVNAIPANNTDSLQVIQKYADGSALLSLPRYAKFNPAINELAKKGFTFKEIAGNNSAILLSVLLPATTDLSIDKTQIVFTQPIASDLSMKRIALVTQVENLHSVLLELNKENIVIEHVFDF
jgi:hypothetical protein